MENKKCLKPPTRYSIQNLWWGLLKVVMEENSACIHVFCSPNSQTTKRLYIYVNVVYCRPKTCVYRKKTMLFLLYTSSLSTTYLIHIYSPLHIARTYLIWVLNHVQQLGFWLFRFFVSHGFTRQQIRLSMTYWFNPRLFNWGAPFEYQVITLWGVAPKYNPL